MPLSDEAEHLHHVSDIEERKKRIMSQFNWELHAAYRKKPNLVNLPYEIMEGIVRHAVIPDPARDQKSSPPRRHKTYPCYGIYQAPIRYTAMPLMLSCKQMHLNVKDILSQAGRDTQWNIDCMLVRKLGLLTTWHLPPIPRDNHIDTIHVNIQRVEPTAALNAQCTRYEWTEQDWLSWSQRRAWPCIFLFIESLSNGPVQGHYYDGNKPPRFTVGRIILHYKQATKQDGPSNNDLHWNLTPVVNPAEVKPDFDFIRLLNKGVIVESGRRIFDETSREADIRLRQAIEYRIDEGFDLLVTPATPRDSVHHRTAIFESVREGVYLMVNGVERREWDVREIWQRDKAPLMWDICQEKYEWIEWLDWILDRRELLRRGLPVGDDRPDPPD